MQRIHFDSGDLLRVSLRSTAGAAVEAALARHQFAVGGSAGSAVWRRQAAACVPRPAMMPRRALPPGDPEIPTGTDVPDGGVLSEVWRRAIAPYWERLVGHLEAECDARGRVAMAGGVQQLLATLHPRISWQSPVLTVPDGPDEDVHLGGRGLVLCPSVFLSHRPGMVIHPRPNDERVLLIFEIPLDSRAAERIWGTPALEQPASLSALVGRTRAAALRVLRVGCTTSQLADRLGISVAGASQHATVLRGAGLITTRRFRNTVLHTVTPLGVALLDGHDAGARPRTGTRHPGPPPSRTTRSADAAR
jgi:DNA-binding transcriptional ArsR family regulator